MAGGERKKRSKNLDTSILRRKNSKKVKELNRSTISFTSLPSNFLHHPSNRASWEEVCEPEGWKERAKFAGQIGVDLGGTTHNWWMANDHAIGQVTKTRRRFVSSLEPINNKARLRCLHVLRKKRKMVYYLFILLWQDGILFGVVENRHHLENMTCARPCLFSSSIP